MTEICENCKKGSKLTGTPQGRIIDTEPLKAYFASASGVYDSPIYTSKVLVISPDIFGFGIDNPKLLADLFANKCGIDVWVPDTFKGNPPMKPEDLEPYVPDHARQKMPLSSHFFAGWNMAKALPGIFSARPSLADTWLVEFISNLRKDYGYTKVALNGYCWGGGHAVRLATMPGVIDLALPTHPSGFYVSAMRKVLVPITYFIAEEDDQWDPKMAQTVQRRWDSRGDAPPLQFITYPGTAHGFGSRPNLSIPQVKEAWEKYVSDLVSVVKEML